VGIFALELCTGVVEHGAAHESAREELLLALHVRRRELAHRARLLELLGGRLDLGRPLAGLQVRKARVGRTQTLFGFAAGGGLVLVLEREQRRGSRDLVAALHRKLLQRSGEWRRDADVFPFDVSLQRPWTFRPARGNQQQRGQRRDGQARDVNI